MTTSRTPLRIAAEQRVPARLRSSSPSAVSLFVERARKTQASFELTPENAKRSEAVCRRLDGLPLALELAAARLRLLSPEALLERLDHTLDVLTSGPATLPSGSRPSAPRSTGATRCSTSPSNACSGDGRLRRGVHASTDVEAVCADPREPVSTSSSRSSTWRSCRWTASASGFACCRRSASTPASSSTPQARRTRSRSDTRGGMRRSPRRSATGSRGTDQVGAVERGIAEEGNLQAALDTLLGQGASRRRGRRARTAMQMCGDLWMYWHIRGKNLTARELRRVVPRRSATADSTVGRAGALLTAGLASWMLRPARPGERRVGGGVPHRRSSSAPTRAVPRISSPGRCRCSESTPTTALRLASGEHRAGVGRFGFAWARGNRVRPSRASPRTLTGDLRAAHSAVLRGARDPAAARRPRGCRAVPRRPRPARGSLGGDLEGALELYRRSLAAFEAVGDRGEEARILSEMAWTHLANGDTGPCAPLLLRLGPGVHGRRERPRRRARR